MNQVKNYDELRGALLTAKTAGEISRRVDSLPDYVLKDIYLTDQWIIANDSLVTGELVEIVKDELKEILVKDILNQAS